MDGRSALVTGVCGEIGACLAEHFLNKGWTVCGLDVKPWVKSGHPSFSFYQCDLGDGEETERSIEIFHDRFGAFDLVINCAGLIANSPLLSFAEGKLVRHDFTLWNRVLSSCLSSAFYVTACAAVRMANERKAGVIVNFSSICSRGNAGQAAYSASKAGLNGLTLALAKELGPLGIRVVALAPGYIDTSSTRENVPPPKLRQIQASVPLHRLGKMEEVVSAVQFILDNEYVNGTVIELAGGQVL